MIGLNKADWSNMLLLALIGALFFIPFLGAAHLFDWDEINFAECAREMLVTGDYFRPQIDYKPFWEKPPLFIWMQVLSMQLFGINEFAARFPNALCGISTLLLVYWAGKRVNNSRFALYWALAWLGSVLPHFYFRSGIIDPWFNFFIYAGLFTFFLSYSERKNLSEGWKHYALAGFLCGLAILCKGPAALLLSGLCFVLFFVLKRSWYWPDLIPFCFFTVIALLVPFLWFGADIVKNGSWFVREFLAYNIRLAATEDSGHGGFFGYHFIVLFIGCFPASIFAVYSLFPKGFASFSTRFFQKKNKEKPDSTESQAEEFIVWNRILFWVVLLLFSIIQTKIVHYSSLCYFPLTSLATHSLMRFFKKKKHPNGFWLLYFIPFVLFVGLLFALPIVGQHIVWIEPLFQNDAFAQANLEAREKWPILVALPGLLLLACSAFALWQYRHGRVEGTVQWLYVAGLLFTAFTVVLVVPKIEAYSQRAAIEFYKSKVGESCRIIPVGFKSYAHLYYAKKTPPDGRPVPTYLVSKINNVHVFEGDTTIVELYRANGFVFLEKRGTAGETKK